MQLKPLLLVTLTTLLTSIQAVTIRNYASLQCAHGYYQCSSISSPVCCTANGHRYGSSRFLELEGNQVGTVFAPVRDRKCGKPINTNSGFHVCVAGTRNLQLMGSRWHVPISGSLEEDSEEIGVVANCTEIVGPDRVVLSDGSVFDTSEATPAWAAEAIGDLLESDASIDDVPVELRAYQIGADDDEG